MSNLSAEPVGAIITQGFRFAATSDEHRILHDQLVMADSVEKHIDSMGEAQLLELLQIYKSELSGSTAYIALRDKLENDGNCDLRNPYLRVGGFFLKNPTLKQLNRYIGQVAANKILADLRELITENFGSDITLLALDKKAGFFMYDIEKYADAHDVNLESANLDLRRRIKDLHDKINKVVADALLRSAKIVFGEWEGLISRKERAVLAFDDAEVEKIDRGIEIARDRFLHINRLRNALVDGDLSADHLPDPPALEEDQQATAPLDTIDPTEEFRTLPGNNAHITIGIVETHEIANIEKVVGLDMAPLFVLFQSLIAEKMNANRTFGHRQEGEESEAGLDTARTEMAERSIVQLYKDEYFSSDLVREYHNLKSTILDDGRLKNEWKPFFNIDDRNRIRMVPKMVAQLREEEVSGEFTEPLTQELHRKVLTKWRDKVDELDLISLKSFLNEYSDRYFFRADRILRLLSNIRKWAQGGSDVEVLRSLAKDAKRELEVSMRDESVELTEAVMHEIRGAAQVLFSSKAKATIFIDHEKLGADNQIEFEDAALDIIDVLGISDDEIDSVNLIGDADMKSSEWKQFINEKVSSMKNEESRYRKYLQIFLRVGDGPTKRILDANKALYRMLSEDLDLETVVVPQGDEAFACGTGMDVKNTKRLRELLEELSRKFKVRIFATITDSSASPEPHDVARRHIANLKKAEEQFERMKLAGGIPVYLEVPIAA